MEFLSLVTLLLAIASSARGAALYPVRHAITSKSTTDGRASQRNSSLVRTPMQSPLTSRQNVPVGTSNVFSRADGSEDSVVRSGLIPGSGSDSGSFGVSGSDGSNFANFPNFPNFFQQQQQQPDQTFFQTVNSDGSQGSSESGQDGQSFFGQVASAPAPIYEEHTRVNSGVRQVTSTITNTVTQTHTLRVPSTSDVWVTSVTMMKMPVTQLTTQRSYVPLAANTVTSVIRITKTPIEVVTRTEEIYPTKTLVSVYTRFVTQTETVELWQNIVHRATNYEVLTVPVVETQTLLQRLFTTTTVTRVVNVTVRRPLFIQPSFPRSGVVTAAAVHAYGR